MIFRHIILLGSFLTLLLSCGVPADYSGRASGTGIGGTGALAEGTGIGGTGILAQGTGIGGTGSLAGRDGERLGIVGRITGFGSIWVNGLEVEYDRNIPVERYDTEIDASGLAEGQVVEVVAVNDNGVMRAEDIGIRYEVIGPIQSLSQDGKELEVLGQRVILVSDTVLPGSWPEGAASSSIVRVSGFRDSRGSILASRVEFGSADDPAHLIGRVGTTAGSLTVSGLPVQMPGGADSLRSGDIIRVSGSTGNGIFEASSVKPYSADLFATRVDRYLVQAMIVSRGGGGSINLGGMPFKVKGAGDTRATGMMNDRPMLFMGTAARGGHFRLQRTAPSPSLRRSSPSPGSIDLPGPERRMQRSPSIPTSRPGRTQDGFGGYLGR